MKLYWKKDEEYPATYSFRDEAVGDSGTDITWISSATIPDGMRCQIIATLDGHDSVLELYDHVQATYIIIVSQTFTAQASGTIEFWVRTTNVSVRSFLLGLRSGTSQRTWMYIGQTAGKWGYYDGAVKTIPNVTDPVVDTWHHVRIDFECGAGAYEGLGADQIQYTIDGIASGALNFATASTTIDNILINSSSNNPAAVTTYLDAIGYSWDTDYTVGDNLINYEWVEITGVVEYPKISTRIGMPSSCTVVLTSEYDSGDDIYTDWSARDKVGMQVRDDNEVVLFDGYLTEKIFKAKSLTLTLVGFGIELDWTPFNKDYILANGYLSEVPYTHIVLDQDLDPNANGATLEWVKVGAANHWEVLQDDSDATYINVSDGGENDIEIVAMEESDDLPDIVDGTVIEVSKIVVHVRCERDITMGSTNETYVRISNDDGASWSAPQTIVMSGTPEDQTATFDGLAWTEAQLDAFQIKITASPVINAPDVFYIYEVYATATVEGTCNEAVKLETEAHAAFTWDDDYWITDRNTGIVITDNESGISTKTWDASADLCVNGSNESGGFADTNTIYDTLKHHYEENTFPDATMTYTIDGDKILMSNSLKKLTVKWRYYLLLNSIFTNKATVTIQIYNNNTPGWETINTSSLFTFSGLKGEYFENPDVGAHIIIEDIDHYLGNDGDEYDDLGIRFIINSLNSLEVEIDIDYVAVDINYHAYNIGTISASIASSGASWIRSTGIDWSENGAEVSDLFQIGESNSTILADICGCLNGIALDSKSTLTKFLARRIYGLHCIDALKSICELEGLYWFEDHANRAIVVAKLADFDDSGVSLTEADYEWDWQYDDKCNDVGAVEVWGYSSTTLVIYAIAKSAVSTSRETKQITDETIITLSDAQEVANAQLAELEIKRPSIKLTLNGVNADLKVGTTVNITLARPTIAAADYPIRMIEREKFGGSIKTTIYAGMGSTEADERIGKTIRDIGFLANKALTKYLREV